MEGSVVSEGLMCKYRSCDSPMEGSVGPVLTYSGEEGSMNSSSLWAMLFISSSWDVDSGEREVRSSVTSSLSVLPGPSLFGEGERLLLESDLAGVDVRELELSLAVLVELLFVLSSWDVGSGEGEVRSSVIRSLNVLPGLSLFEERERLLLDSDLVGVGVRELELSLGVFVELGLTLGVLVELGLEVEATDAALLGVFVGHGS